jgi:hypothetical protein
MSVNHVRARIPAPVHASIDCMHMLVFTYAWGGVACFVGGLLCVVRFECICDRTGWV